ncbi:hypothetical protein HCN51_00985 [Nonomuraea sp. FMUSA5-5]|uniref:Uncharacterized protein n=1 Tax=Nonomuraea composti TaxID=2720023 RepID=A0ABX1AR02_9ACTN|nr:hypothetical protein [Nonomuraea sp. FMUSA5-5]NJP88043.1 hypothetical protein [Nonomuraea sp. FMUSA5-5]
MDIRAEILDLKLRVEDLETAAERVRESQEQETLLREVIDRTKRAQAEMSALRADLAEVRKLLGGGGPGAEGDVRTEIAVEFEVIRSKVEHEFNFLRSEVMDLAIKVDRLTPDE